MTPISSDLVGINLEVQFNFRDSVELMYQESVELLLQEEGQAELDLDKACKQIEALYSSRHLSKDVGYTKK
ncbi:hypothetical protein [uncultured Nostoc sp.]|uniref:hypothetical protein n=1 Tax=uncultured Nostoc sp. TaxID=340711 RepID=UPI0035CA5AA1